MVIHFCEDFTDAPGGRSINDGDFSGEAFRRTLLIPKVTEAIKNGENLIIYLDGAYGYPIGFLEEAFGGLIRELDADTYLKALDIIEFKSEDFQKSISDITELMNDAIEARKSLTPSFNTARQHFISEISHNGELQNLPSIEELPVSKITEQARER